MKKINKKNKINKINKTRKIIRKWKGGNLLINYIKNKDEANAIKHIQENNGDIFKYDSHHRDPLFYAEKYNLTEVINEINQTKLKPRPRPRPLDKTRREKEEATEKEEESEEKDAYEPFLNAFINSNKWLELDDDHIIIVYRSNKLCLKKSYFNNIITDHLILTCIIKNNTLLFKETMKQKQYISLKPYGCKDPIIVEENKLVSKIKTKRIILLTDHDKKVFGISKMLVIHNPMSYDHYVKQYGIQADYQNPLAFYTSKWDNVINGYLRQGDPFFDHSTYFMDNIAIFGKNKPDAIKNIKNKLLLIDNAFHDAPLTQTNLVLYRGVKHKIDEPLYSGLQLSFLSTTDDFNTAISFTSYENNCCIYKLILDIGIPYIYLDFISQTQGENEFLLPRNLILEFKKQYKKEDENVFEFFATLDDNHRYKNTALCKEYSIFNV